MTDKAKKVAPIPKGYRSLTPHVLVHDVAAAVALYQTALGAEVTAAETAAGSDVQVFAQLRIGNSMLTVGMGEAYGAGQVMLHHYVEDFDTAWNNALAAGFAVLDVPAETWWGDRLGVMIDPVGVRWSFAQRVVRLTAQERTARAAVAQGLEVAAAETPAEDATEA